jgi:phospholipase/carboxylesterase
MSDADDPSRAWLEARLSARPGAPPTADVTVGLDALELGDPPRDGLLHIPAGYRHDRPAPLLVMLHGATGNARHAVRSLLDEADERGFVLLAPDSRATTWDVIAGGYGPDIAFLDRALEKVFAMCAIDPQRIALAGISDGASYALSVGITNGDLFTHVIAWSPGFVAPRGQNGMPKVFISHGTQDPILPIDACSRRIAPGLHQAGYDVRYLEFDGGHTVPPEIAAESLRWFVDNDED